MLTGDLVVPGEMRLRDDEWISCPIAASAEPWAQEVLRARRLLSEGAEMRSIVRRPSAPFLDALAFVAIEVEARQAFEAEEQRRKLEEQQRNAGRGAR